MHSATILRPIEISAPGLFSGQPCAIRIDPAAPGSGISFIVDGTRIPAHPDSVCPVPNHTLLERDGAQVRVTEHLLCALWAAGIDTADIVQLAGPELPNFDGSALPFYEALESAGRIEHGPRPVLRISEPLRLEGEGCSFELEPAEQLSIRYYFDHPELGAQEFAWEARRELAAAELLPARTFATQSEVGQAQAAGLLLNDDELAGLVIRDGVPNQSLRFANEYARHKVLDLLGDLYLLPFDWPCRLAAQRTGHAMNHKLGRMLWEAAQRGEIEMMLPQ